MGRLRRARLLFACAAALAGADVHAAPDEYQVKAVFLFNFSQFVDWPDSSLGEPGSPFAICIYGPDPFGGQLESAVRRESVRGHPMSVRRLGPRDDADSCRMLFIGAAQPAQLDGMLKDLHERAILTVSDIAGSAEHGAMIQFSKDNQRLRLRINVGAARAAGLTISSQLLRPAEIVGPMEGEPHA